MRILDATTLETVADLPLAGFNRLNAAGDGRHLLVSTQGGFRVLDAGAWTEPHGDHAHHYTSAPRLTDVLHPAEEPGHVVVHDGHTALFDDGTGEVVVRHGHRVAAGADGRAQPRTAPQSTDRRSSTRGRPPGPPGARGSQWALNANDSRSC